MTLPPLKLAKINGFYWVWNCTSVTYLWLCFLWIKQVLSLCSAACASAYFVVLSNLCSYMTTFHAAHTDVVIGTCDNFAYKVHTENGGSFSDHSKSVSFDSKSSVGWILALSFVAFIYQILAVLQLFLDFKIPNMKKVLCKCTCTIFFLTVCYSLLMFEII